MTTETRFPLLRECFEAGSVVNLFPVMRDWSKAKIGRLLAEVEEFGKLATEEYSKLSVLPENFFSATASNSLDRARFEVDCILSEICSVAEHYRNAERGIEDSL